MGQPSPALDAEATDVAALRCAAHVEWKRKFFRSRPPPPSIGRLHRRAGQRCKRTSCRPLFEKAVSLIEMSEQQRQQSTLPASADEEGVVGDPQPPQLCRSTTGSSSAAPHGADADAEESRAASAAAMEPLSKHEKWLHQMLIEQQRRCPATDLHVRSDATKTVIMANLHPDTAEAELHRFADQFGRVVSLRIVRHQVTGRSRRYAFVEYGLVGEAKKAASFHRKKRLKGYSIIIDEEKGRRDASFLPRRMATALKLHEKQTSMSEEKGGVVAAKEEEGCSARGGAPTSALLADDDDFLNSILNS